MYFLPFEEPLEKIYNKLFQEHKNLEDNELESLLGEFEKQKQTLYSNLNAWDKVLISRHPDRPLSLAYIDFLTQNSFIELNGDRLSGNDSAIIGGLGFFEGQTVMFIGHQKGNNTKQRQFRNFGMANPSGYRKALRLMKLAEKFNFPIVTFIDTPGAFPGIEAEERGQGEAIAKNIFEMLQLKVPILSIIIGEGASGGAIGIGIGDRIMMFEYTWYSVISPESCSSILWRSRENKHLAAESLKLSATDMLEQKLIDGILPEPLGGAHWNPDFCFDQAKNCIHDFLKEYNNYNTENLINLRLNKYIAMGVFNTNE